MDLELLRTLFEHSWRFGLWKWGHNHSVQQTWLWLDCYLRFHEYTWQLSPSKAVTSSISQNYEIVLVGRWSFFHDGLSVEHQGQGDIPQQCSETCLHTCDIEGKRQLHAPFLTERNGNYNTRSFDHHGKQTIIGSSKKVYCYDVIIFLEYIKKFFRIH